MADEADPARVDATTGLPVAPRGRPLSFTFDGRSVRGYAGDTVASALHAHGERVLMRSIKYHRPRGYFCGVGKCASCLVRVDGVPNARACTTPARPGMKVETQNAIPSARFDVLSIVDKVYRRTFDYHAKFIRPAFMRPIYHAVIRRMAGFGDPPAPRSTPPASPPIRVVEADVAVVGAGAAGLAAARAAAKAGARVLLVDESPRLGGTLRLESEPLGAATGDARGPDYAAAALDELARAGGAVTLAGATAFGLYRDAPLAEPHGTAPEPEPAPRSDVVGALALVTAEGVVEARPRALVVAAGAHEVPPLFPANDLPGIMGARAAQRLLLDHGVLPGREVVVMGEDPLAGLVAAQCEAAGARVVARTDAGGVRAARGGRWLAAVELADGERVACDALLVAASTAPRVELLQQADCRLAFDEVRGVLVPELDEDGATTTPGVFAAGACAGSRSAAASVAAGERAGRAAATWAEGGR